MFQWQKWPTIGKKLGSTPLLKKCAFQPSNQCPRPNRGDLEKKKVVHKYPFIRYETIHHLEPMTEFLYLKTGFYKLWVIFESGNILLQLY